MSILSKVIERGNMWDKMVDEISSSHYRVIVYGNGNSGQKILEKLEPTIQPVGVAVGHKYYSEGMEFCGYKVIDVSRLSEILKEKTALIFSICPDQAMWDMVTNVNNLEKVYCYDGQQLLFPSLDYSYIQENEKWLTELYNSLEDELSKETMAAYLNCRISGNLLYCQGLMSPGLYFNTDILTYASNEVFVDCGAYTGDTIIKFKDFTNGYYEKIVAFEPNEKNFTQLSEITKGICSIELIKKGVWDRTEVLRFDAERGSMSGVSDDGKISIEVDRLDNYLQDQKITFIKMNIEGSELKALIGAEKTIKSNDPKLAISVYHKPEDLVEIPKLIQAYNAKYKFALRTHSMGSGLTVLYAHV